MAGRERRRAAEKTTSNTAEAPEPVWRDRIACVATYNVLEHDDKMDQFEDVAEPRTSTSLSQSVPFVKSNSGQALSSLGRRGDRASRSERTHRQARSKVVGVAVQALSGGVRAGGDSRGTP